MWKIIVLSAMLLACSLISAERSSALWLGLTDGIYSVNQTPNNSGDPSASGTITISGAGISSWNIDFTDLTQNFTGNPADIDSFPPCCEVTSAGMTEAGVNYGLLLDAEFANNVDPAPWLWARTANNLTTGDFVRIEGSWTFASVPEPAALILMIGGSFFIGFSLKKRRVGT